MVDKGFYIAKVVATGEGKKDAFVDLEPGPNVITGLSDTGKSFIFACINHAFGSQDEIELPEEGSGYTTVYVQLNDFEDSQTWTIKRDFNGAVVTVYECGYDEIDDDAEADVLKLQHSDKNETISSFLLNRSGFPKNVFLKKNMAGDTSIFSFRVLWDFVAVDEITILTKKSPVTNDLVYNKTKQRYAFEYILTGKSEQARAKKTSGKKKTDSDNLAGQLELCGIWIAELTRTVSNLEASKAGYGAVADLEKEIAESTTRIAESGDLINQKLLGRNKLLGQLETIESKSRSVEQMRSRFSLLKEHYNSDLARLDFVSEGHFLLAQLQESMCPTCGQEVADNKHEHDSPNENEELVQLACKNEIEKTRRNLMELEETLLGLEAEKEKLEVQASKVRALITSEETTLQKSLGAKWTADKNRLNELLSYQRIVGELSSVQARLNSLRVTQGELKKRKADDEPTEDEIESAESTENPEAELDVALAKLAKRIEKLVKAWQFSNDPITFDKKALDFRIGNKARKAFGAGKRGVLYSAFLIGLLNFSIGQKRAHPHFILLDSPLTNHKGKKLLSEAEGDDDDEIAEEVKDAFFDYLTGIRLDRQIIVVENETPAVRYQESINTIIFTKDELDGRA